MRRGSLVGAGMLLGAGVYALAQFCWTLIERKSDKKEEMSKEGLEHIPVPSEGERFGDEHKSLVCWQRMVNDRYAHIIFTIGDKKYKMCGETLDIGGGTVGVIGSGFEVFEDEKKE